MAAQPLFRQIRGGSGLLLERPATLSAQIVAELRDAVLDGGSSPASSSAEKRT